MCVSEKENSISFTWASMVGGTHSYNELAYNGYMLDFMQDSMRDERGRSLVCVRAICVDGACAVSVVERGLSTMHLGCGCLAPAAADVARLWLRCAEHELMCWSCLDVPSPTFPVSVFVR